MKKLLYILFSLFVLPITSLPPFEGGLGRVFSSTPVMAQTAGHKVDSIYVYNVNDSLIYMQEWFYEGNNVTNEVQYTWDKEGVKHGDFNTFKAFDAKGNNVLYVTLEWSDIKQDWVGRGRFENVYNEDSKFSYHALWKEDQWKKDSIWLCQYNAQKQPILTLHQLFRNGEWQDQYKLIQDYDGSREIYHEEYSGRDANGLIGIKKWSQMYNGSTKISDHQYQWSGTAFVPSSWDTVGIVGGKTTLKESYVWTNGVQTGKSKEEWEFNGSGRQTLHITYSGWENNAFVPKEKQVDEWSGSTNTMTAKYSWDKTNKKWVGTSKTENITSGGYTIKKTYSGWDGTDFIPSTIDSTKNENSKKVYYVKWTYSNGSWKGSSKEIYAFDANKNQTLQEKYSSWSNGSWIGSNSQKWEQIWKNNKVWSKVTYNWSNGWVPSIKDSTEYSGSDITLSVHYKYVNGAWEGDGSKSNYSQTYISPGQKEWTITLKWENNQWNNFIQTRSVYEGGKLKEERSQQWSGSAWQDVKVVYHTWENGVETFTRTEEWNTEAGKLKMTKQTKCEIIMQDEKKVEEAYYECLADSVWYGVKPWRTTWENYTTDTTSVAATITYSWIKNKSAWQNKSKSATITGINELQNRYSATGTFTWTEPDGWEITYSMHEKWLDAKGRTIKEQQVKCEYGFRRIEYIYENAYDNQDRQIMSSQLNGSTGNKTENVYDENGNKTLVRYSSWNSAMEDWLPTSEEVYQYDDQNRKTDFEKTTQQAGTGILIKSQKEKYFYNGSEKKAYSTLKYEYVIPTGEDAERWIVKQEDTYKYDDNDSSQKLREEIHGTWSKGVVIKYERTHYFYNDDPK